VTDSTCLGHVTANHLLGGHSCGRSVVVPYHDVDVHPHRRKTAIRRRSWRAHDCV